MKKPIKIVFDSSHSRITPNSREALLACEPLEIAQMIYLVRNQDYIFEQIKNKSWRSIVARIDNYDITRNVVYIQSHLLEEWIEFLVRVIIKPENTHEHEQSELAMRDKRYIEKLLRYLTKTQGFAVYLERSQTINLFALTGQDPRGLLDAETANIDGLLEAKRWCSAYASVLERGNCQSYFLKHGIDQASLGRMSVFQLKALGIWVAEDIEKTLLLKNLKLKYSSYHGVSDFSDSFSLRELKECQAMLEAKIGYDDKGQIIAYQTH